LGGAASVDPEVHGLLRDTCRTLRTLSSGAAAKPLRGAVRTPEASVRSRGIPQSADSVTAFPAAPLQMTVVRSLTLDAGFRMTKVEGLNSKHDGLVSVHEYAIFNMRSHGTREHNFLQVAPLADEILDRVTVRYADYVLLDDRAIVEDFGDVVAGGADQFHAAFERLVIGTGTDKCGQK
jgi:hypothetical protein